MTRQERIEQARKAQEDLIHANVREIFQAKNGELPLVVGNNVILLPGNPYSSANIYEITFFSAVDTDGVDIADAVILVDQDINQFIVSSPRVGQLRWQTCLKTPQFNFWT